MSLLRLPLRPARLKPDRGTAPAALVRTPLLVLLGLFTLLLAPLRAMTWSGDPGPWGSEPMNALVQTWDTYATYGYNIPVYYHEGIPTAQADYRGAIGFGGQGNYRTAMHESAHWLGTGTTGAWYAHQRWSVWNGTYTVNLRRAFDGPGERQMIYGVHYGPDGANYDSEGVNGPRFVGVVGAFRRDQDLADGDLTIGIASGTYRLRNRTAVKVLDSLGATTEGASLKQGENTPTTTQQWQVNLLLGTRHFTLQNVATGKYLDSLGAGTDGAAVALTSLVGGVPTDNQLWEIVPTDSFFFKIINKANGRALDNEGLSADGADVKQRAAAGNNSWNQHWTFLHPLVQSTPPAGVVSQGRPTSSSSTDGAHYDTKGNNGVAGDRWTASSGSYPQWWQVDLGSVQPITKVEVDWFRDGAPVFRYRIEVSDDGTNFTVAADRTGNTVTGTTVDRLLASGRYVRVVVTGVAGGGYWAAFYECRVYNEVQPMRLLSLFRPTSASSEQAGNLAVNANDVDPVFTRWCSNSPGYPAWWQIDLGSAQPVNKAVIQWFDDNGRSYRYRIEGSTDGVNFATLIDRTANTRASDTTDLFSGVARYLRVTITGGSADYPSLYDVQIYGAVGPQPTATPAGLTATAAAAQINLAWLPVPGATSYQVKRALSPGGPFTLLASPAATTHADTTALPGLPYHYVVSATDAVGTGADSAPVVAAIGAELRAWLPFDETTGALAADASGLGRTATLVNGPVWAAGNVGNAIDLDGSDDHVSLPAGIVSGLNDFTIAAWINPEVHGNWARLFDFGTGTDNYMFLAPTNGTQMRFAIRTPSVGEQQLSAAPLPTGVWSHVAVTLSGNTATLYLNGTAVATNTAVTLRPANLGVTTNNWLGRAQFADPYLNGKIDDFRIYNRALNTTELARLRGVSVPASAPTLAAQAGDGRLALAWSPVLGATSYRIKRATVSGGPYTTLATVAAAHHTDTGLSNGTAYHYVVSALNAAGESADSAPVSATPAALPPAPPAALVPAEIGSQIRLLWSASPSATGYQVKRSTVSGGPYTTLATLGATTAYTDASVVPGLTYHYVVSATGPGGESADSAPATAAPAPTASRVLLKMDETAGATTADETGGGWTGTLVNGVTRVAAGRLDRALGFDGADDHVTLPAGVVETLGDCTFSVWVRPGSLATWSRVFDFGTGTDNYLFLSVQGSNGRPTFSIRTPGVAQQDIYGSAALATNTWTHLAVTFSGHVGTLYVNGAVSGANGSMTLTPASLGRTTNNWLGRSQWPDPYLNGQLDEFRILDRALTPSEIAALATPPAAPAGLAATAGAGEVALSWNAVAGATGYTVKRATVSGGPYTAIAENLPTTTHTDTAVSAGTAYHYVVTALKTVAESAKSTQATATPTAPLTPAQTWRQANFGTTADSGDAADAADPDEDGVVNLLERAFAGDPLVADTSILPAVDPAAPVLSLVYRRAKSATDLVFTVEESTDLADAWSVSTGEETIVEDAEEHQQVRHTRPLDSDARLFLRLRVSESP